MEDNKIPVSESPSQKILNSDNYVVDGDTLAVTLLGHASVMLEYKGKTIQIDPYSAVTEYSALPKADLILLTHEHSDHLDRTALDLIKKDATDYYMSQSCFDILGHGKVLKNGDQTIWNNIVIDAVPAYNIVHKRPDGEYYHPKGRGNGYVLQFGKSKFRIYIAGDTENIPEMEQLKGTINVAFLPQNLPYTMDQAMFVNAALIINPKILYKYHAKQGDIGISKPIAEAGINQILRPMSSK